MTTTNEPMFNVRGHSNPQKVALLLADIALPTVVFTMLLSVPLIIGTSIVTNDMELVGFLMRHLWVLSLCLAVCFGIRYVVRLRRVKPDQPA